VRKKGRSERGGGRMTFSPGSYLQLEQEDLLYIWVEEIHCICLLKHSILGQPLNAFHMSSFRESVEMLTPDLHS
jgi:hypothetical protein